MSHARGWLLATVVLFSIDSLAGTKILYDFEAGVEDWAPEWGIAGPLTASTSKARSGKGSLLLEHEFKKGNETIGVRVMHLEALNLSQEPGFEGYSAWVYFPGGDEWEAQIYVHTGPEWAWREGKLNSRLQPGWHQIFITKQQIGDLTEIRDLGIQIKNYKLRQKAAVCIDRIEAMYSGGK